MEKETPQNDSSEDDPDFWEPAQPKDPIMAMGYLHYQKYQREETIECPNCSADIELMTVYKDDGTIDHQVFYCWQCDNAVPSDYDPSDEDDFDEEGDELG